MSRDAAPSESRAKSRDESRGRRGPTLAAIRRRIDRSDERLLRLLNQRARLALVIGRIKDQQKWPVFDPMRETVVLRHVSVANRGPLSVRAVRRIFGAILRECRRREDRPRQRP